MKLSKISIAVLGLGLSASVWAYPTWNVNDTATAYKGADSLNTVDVLNGRYTGEISQTAISSSLNNGVFTSVNKFSETGVADLASYFLDGVSLSTGLNASRRYDGYRIYGLFDVSGSTTFATSNGVTSLTGYFTSGDVKLYLDPNRDSVTGAAGSKLTATIGADDKLIGSASLISSSSIVIANLANTKGSYGVTFSDFTLTDFGKTYWDAPVPFHNRFTLSGENENFRPALIPGNYTGIVFGDASVNAEVPEPASLALIGLGLLGMSSLRRRNKA